MPRVIARMKIVVIGMGLILNSGKRLLMHKADVVPLVGRRHHVVSGGIPTTTTRRESFEAYSVVHATLPSAWYRILSTVYAV